MRISCEKGVLFVVATPIGNLDDITIRAVDTLKTVDVIAAETVGYSKKLLKQLGVTAQCVHYSEHNWRQRVGKIVRLLKAGKNVALISNAGTPTISDPGYKLVCTAIKEGIKVVPVPGPCAAISALSCSGLPTDKFTFVGFLPDRQGRRRKLLSSLAKLDHTLVFYISPHKLQKTLNDIFEIFGRRRAALIREMTKIYEEKVYADLEELVSLVGSRNVKGEITLVVGKC